MSPEVRQAGIREVTFGAGCVIVEPVNLYGCTLGDDVFVGPFVEIQRRVEIGASTRIQSHAFICELVTVGSHCFISHGAKFTNYLFSDGDRAAGRGHLLRPTVLGDHVVVGTNATILPVRVCSHVVIAAGSVVTKDITDSGVYAGNPARFLRSLKKGDGA